MRDLILRVPGLRPFVRVVRRWGDRLLHPGRREHARTAIAHVDRLQRIVILCLGNINRSAYAAALLRVQLDAGGGDAPEVLSAGFMGPDRPSPPEAVALAGERGVDLSLHRSQLVTREIVHGAQLVIVMSRWQRRAVVNDLGFLDSSRVVMLGDLDPLRVETREIRDPFGQERQVYQATFDRIERCIGALVETLRTSVRQSQA